ncbi:hypothetical protein [Isoalcanivorax pacificus]|uniref:hypothetical protein n=1 Tax=Isoalcanivorax pacificus TaxID=1306787 RepID=UPI0011866AA1|nr:hypothetical protein [Isoalcanivorax pacificus]
MRESRVATAVERGFFLSHEKTGTRVGMRMRNLPRPCRRASAGLPEDPFSPWYARLILLPEPFFHDYPFENKRYLVEITGINHRDQKILDNRYHYAYYPKHRNTA